MRVDKPTLALLYWIIGSLLMGGLIPGENAFAVEDLKHMEILSSNSVEINVSFEGRGWNTPGSSNPYEWQVSFTANVEGTSGWDDVDVSYALDFADGTQETREWTFRVYVSGWDTENAGISIDTNGAERVELEGGYDALGIYRTDFLELTNINPKEETSRSDYETWPNFAVDEGDGFIDWTVSWSGGGGEPDIRVVLGISASDRNPSLVGEEIGYRCLVDGKQNYTYTYRWYVGNPPGLLKYYPSEDSSKSYTWGASGLYQVGCMVGIGGKFYHAKKYPQRAEGDKISGNVTLLSFKAQNVSEVWKIGENGLETPNKALIVGRGLVYSFHMNYNEGEYEITSSAELPGTPEAVDGNVQWGGLADSTDLVTTFPGPLQAGKYNVTFEVIGLEEQTHTTALVWLPEAGPDICEAFKKEIEYIRGEWGSKYKAKLDERMRVGIDPLAEYDWWTRFRLASKDLGAIGERLDYKKDIHHPSLEMYETASLLPPGFATGGSNWNRNDERILTLCGVPIDAYAHSNIMYAFLGVEMGVFEPVLEGYPNFSQFMDDATFGLYSKLLPVANGAWDEADTFAAYKAGFALHKGQSLQNVMKSYGEAMQKPGSNVPLTWPSDEIYTEDLEHPDWLLELIE